MNTNNSQKKLTAQEKIRLGLSRAEKPDTDPYSMDFNKLKVKSDVVSVSPKKK